MSSRWLREVAAVASLVLASGCSAPAAPPSAWPTAVRSDDVGPLDEAAFRAVVTTVSAARGLAEVRPVQMTIVPRDVYEQNLRALTSARPSAPDRLAADEAFALGFDFLPPPGARRADAPDAIDLRVATSAGVYIRPRDLILLPETGRVTRRARRSQLAVLAHEVQHALQARHFERSGTRPAALDGGLAHQSLVEGDANAAMIAFGAVDQGVPLGRALRQVLRFDPDVPAAHLAHADAVRRRRIVDAASVHARVAQEFPYVEGTLFVTDLVRAGGFGLVDRAFESPPTTTEQILHPEKYFAGEEARPVAALRQPPGYGSLHGDSLGELHARTLFRRCARSEAEADAAAAGWGGDRFEVFAGPDRQLVVAWVSAWDSEGDAREVEALLGERRSCWSANLVEHPEGTFTVGADVQVSRDGAVVTLIRGGGGHALAAWSRTLARAVGEPPARTRRFDVPYRLRLPLPAPQAGMFEGDLWTSEWLGLVVPRPSGAWWEKTDPTTVAARRKDAPLQAAVGYTTRRATPRFLRQTLDEEGELLAAELGGRLRNPRTTGVKTHLGPGVQRVWELDRTGEVRVILLPICNDTGAIVIQRAHLDEHGDDVLDDWFEGIHWLRGRDVPACAHLDPR